MTLSPNFSLLFNLCISCLELLAISLEVRKAKKVMGLTLKQYIQHIIQLGGGLPLDAIRKNKAKQLNKDHVMLLVKKKNVNAISLYEKLGFKKYQEGIMMNGIEGIYYVKYL